MNKNQIIAISIALFLLVSGIIWWGLREDKQKEVLDQSITTYFYGETCPHCRDVRKYLDENKIAEKYSFVMREVWSDRNNARLMQEAAKVCSLKTSEIAVPFVFSEGKCLVGTPKVIEFFKQKAGI